MSNSEPPDNVLYFKPKIVALDSHCWHLRVIVRNYSAILAFAVDSYDHEGRGVVIIDFNEIKDEGKDKPYTVPLYYYAENSEELKLELQDNEQFQRKITAWLSEYDPEYEFIVGIARLDGTTDYRHIPYFEELLYPDE